MLVVYTVMFYGAFEWGEDGGGGGEDDDPTHLDSDEPYQIDISTIQDDINSYSGVLVYKSQKKRRIKGM